MDTFQVRQLIIRNIHTKGEEQSCISSVDNLMRAELPLKELRIRSTVLDLLILQEQKLCESSRQYESLEADADTRE